MCRSCWEEHYEGSIIDNPAIREAAAAIDRVYEYHPAGGGLHVIVDDFNLEDDLFDEETVDFIRRCAEGAHDLNVQLDCFHKLKALSVPERASALALHDGYWLG